MLENPVLDWVMDANSCFLLGAGCSAPAGKPMMDGLTAQVIAGIEEPAKSLFARLEGIHGGAPTVEDLLNQVLQLKSVMACRKGKKIDGWELANCDESIKKILSRVITAVGCQWQSSATHEDFLKRLAGHAGRKVCDIFTLNYDVLIEATLEELSYLYTDGFWGAENAYFDVNTFDQEPTKGPFFRLYKLHGSVNWSRDSEGCVRRRPGSAADNDRPQVIYPCEQKYVQSQYGVYEALLGRFRQRLRDPRPNNKLVVLGYSMRDEHIVEAILDGVRAPGSNLTVYVLVGAEPDEASQLGRFQKLVEQGMSRLNVMIGDSKFLGPALEKSDWDDIRSQNCWMFENLVGFLAGGKK